MAMSTSRARSIPLTVGLAGCLLPVSGAGAAQPVLVRDLDTRPGTSRPHGFLPVGDGRVLFLATDADRGTEPWVTDGTSAGTHLLRDVHPGGGSRHSTQLSGTAAGTTMVQVTPAGRTLNFVADDGPHTRELWRVSR